MNPKETAYRGGKKKRRCIFGREGHEMPMPWYVQDKTNKQVKLERKKITKLNCEPMHIGGKWRCVRLISEGSCMMRHGYEW